MEETLNAMLDAEADRLYNAERYERTEARKDTRAGHYTRKLLVKNGRRTGFEIKISDAPKLTPSMSIALQDLELEGLYVVHGGIHSWDMADRIRAVPVTGLPKEI